jgi:uncharacterized Zn finger protein
VAWYEWAPYVSVAERRQQAAFEVARLREKGRTVTPVVIEGRTIARSFWGRAWCDNLERYSDLANRLPRGRTYVRNGSVMHLALDRGTIKALVSGSRLYRISVTIAPLSPARWRALVQECAGKIGSLVELLQGRFSRAVMETMIRRETGLFPSTREIVFRCSCPDSAAMCKHVAATLYGVGARLDTEPELFFRLRRVDQLDLLSAAGRANLPARGSGARKRIADTALAEVFGIELDGSPGTNASTEALGSPGPARARRPRSRPTAGEADAARAARARPGGRGIARGRTAGPSVPPGARRRT